MGKAREVLAAQEGPGRDFSVRLRDRGSQVCSAWMAGLIEQL